MRAGYVISLVAARYDVDPEEIRSRAKSQRVMEAKRTVIYLLRRLGYGYTAIARELGLHHAAVMAQADKAARMLDERMRALEDEVCTRVQDA